MATEATGHVIERLRDRKRQLANRHQRVTSDRRRSADPLHPDFEEQATQRANDEVLDALDAAEVRELAEIEEALARIDAGSFGQCDECGGEVDPLRLEILPATAFCRPCAEAEDRTAS